MMNAMEAKEKKSNKLEVEINVLINDYNEMQKHLLAATSRKVTLSTTFVTLFCALVGANYFQYVDTRLIFLFSPYLLATYLFIYGQNETEYWVAYVYLERIERKVNALLQKSDTLAYYSQYKRFLFPRNHERKLSFVCFIQYLRIIPALLVFGFIFDRLCRKYDVFNSWTDMGVMAGGLALSIIGLIFVKLAKIGTQNKLDTIRA